MHITVMTREIWPAEGVFFARVHEDLVVLGVDADEYACLPDAGDWLRPDACVLIAPGPEQAEQLIEAGLASPSRPENLNRRPVAPRDRIHAAGRAARLDMARTLAVLATATLAFRGKTFRQLIQSSQGRPMSEPLDEARLERCLAAYEAVLPWVPGEGECLQRSFQLKRLLTRQGFACDWVFGVRTWPFGAHCWIQVGDRVVGDTLGRVRAYTGIMVV